MDNPCKPMVASEVADRREVYLDHNATTPVRREVLDALIEHYQSPDLYGNPNSLSKLGKAAHAIMEDARARIAKCLGAESRHVLFTSCGTAANTTAIKGTAFRFMEEKGHLITTATEHASVLESYEWLEELGFETTVLPVEPDGRVSPDAVRDALRPDTRLVSVMAVNNEIGTINPIGEIGEICQAAGVPLFVDAIQGFGKVGFSFKKMGISMLSISGHKIYAPKGIAALFIADDVELVPMLHGGGQESGRRSGTQAVGQILALSTAVELACSERKGEQERLGELQRYFLERLAEVEPDHVINGSLEHRVANNLNVGLRGVDSGSVLLSLNDIGVYVSSGSACHAGATEASHVLRAIGADTENYGSLRFSFGIKTTKDDLDYLFQHLPGILDKLRRGEVAASA